MRKIEMVDIRSQYLRLQPDIDAGIADVLKTAAFIKGPAVKAFREELANFLGVPHVIPCGNGTDALQVAFMALGLKPGDEVITTNFTFISTVEVLVLLGLKPVMVDVDPLTYNIDPEKIPAAITPKTRAILPVHLFGQTAGMERIQEIATSHHLFIIEDNAQSLGANFTFSNGIRKKAGTIGNIGTTSFYPSKPLACYGDGGALFTSDPQLAETIEKIANHGTATKYYHDLIGVNSRLDTLQAAILRINLKNLDDFTGRRRKVASIYDERFRQNSLIGLPVTAQNSSHVYHQYTIRLDPAMRDSVREKLKEKGIPTMIYYPVPLSLQKAFNFAGYREGDFPVSEKLCKSVLSLPMHTEMDADQIDYICTNLLNILNHE